MRFGLLWFGALVLLYLLLGFNLSSGCILLYFHLGICTVIIGLLKGFLIDGKIDNYCPALIYQLIELLNCLATHVLLGEFHKRKAPSAVLDSMFRNGDVGNLPKLPTELA